MSVHKKRRWQFYALALFTLFLVLFKQIHPEDKEINERFFQNRPEFIYRKNTQRLLICRTEYYTNELKELYMNPEEPFKKKKSWIKTDDKKTILTWRVGGNKYVIKKYHGTHFFTATTQVIPYLPSKALRAFYYSYLFDKMDIQTAKSIAVIEKKIGPLRGDCYLIMEYIHGMKGPEFFDDKRIPEVNYKKSIRDTLRLTKQLEHYNLIHGQLNLSHLFYVEGKPLLIDLDAVQRFKSKSTLFKKKHLQKDLYGLFSGLDEKLKREERKYFEHCYEETLLPSEEIVAPEMESYTFP